MFKIWLKGLAFRVTREIYERLKDCKTEQEAFDLVQEAIKKVGAKVKRKKAR
jgi:predicted CopG family antitoxin